MEAHIVKSYAKQMRLITSGLEEMGECVLESIGIAGETITTPDAALREKVKANDKHINALQDRIDQLIAEMFSKQTPMGSELRMVLSAHKIAGALERIGDLAKNNTKRLVRSDVAFSQEAQKMVQQLAGASRLMLKDALAAFSTQNEQLALAVWKRDDEADTLCRKTMELLLDEVCAVPGKQADMADVMFSVKQFERIADYACDIAKAVFYVTSGKRPTKAMLEE